ncbi:MAG: hypothetical protein NG740_07205 [Omnitrophica bacterium]|nr:hypothetical protein [Candidatus Omnitrophota bacterium]
MRLVKKHILIIDSREQKPLAFYKSSVRVVTKKLDYGDYRMKFLDGKLADTVFERKTIPDLFGTMTKNHERFKKEMKKAHSDGVLMILIVEGSLSKVAKGIKHSKIQGISIIRTVFSLWVRYGVIPAFVENRFEAAEFIIQYFMAEYRKKQNEKI